MKLKIAFLRDNQTGADHLSIGNLCVGSIHTSPSGKHHWLEIGAPGQHWYYKHHFSTRERAFIKARERLDAMAADLAAGAE